MQYTETDFSKTRLRQRRKREAKIGIAVTSEGLTITLPATTKAHNVTDQIKQEFDIKRGTDLPVEKVDFELVPHHAARTHFFTKLISGLPGYSLENVTNVKVNSSSAATDDGADEDELEADENLRAWVKDVALNGSSVLSSSQYTGLADSGFHISSIRWRVKQEASPYTQLDLTAGFDDPDTCTGFSFAVKGMLVRRGDAYVKVWRAIPDDELKGLLEMVDALSISIFRELTEVSQPESSE